MKFFRPVLLLAALFLAVQSAGAEPDKKKAEKLFKEARSLMTKGDYSSALDKLEESKMLAPKIISTYVNLAECQEHLGRLRLAQGTLRAAIELMELNDKRFPELNKRIEALTERLGKLHLKYEGQAPPGLKIALTDGAETRTVEINMTVPVDPGTLKAVANAPNFESLSIEIKVGEKESVELLIPALRSTLPPPPPVASSAGPVESSSPPVASAPVAPSSTAVVYQSYWNGRRTAGVIAGGVGAGGIIIASITGAMMLNYKSKFDSGCNAQRQCSNEAISAKNSANDLSVVNAVSWGLGAAGLGLGAYLFFTASSSTQAAIVPAPNGFNVTLQKSF